MSASVCLGQRGFKFWRLMNAKSKFNHGAVMLWCCPGAEVPDMGCLLKNVVSEKRVFFWGDIKNEC